MTKSRIHVFIAGFALLLSFACHKPAVQTPASPAPAASTASEKPTINYFDAEPSIVTAGQGSSLRWSIDNATNVEISPEIGQVKANDRHLISPAQTATYVLKASNAAGTVEASVTVTVSRPPPPAQGAEEGESSINVVSGQLRDVHFDYNEGEVKL